MNLPTHVYAFALALAALVGIIVLTALHVGVPSILANAFYITTAGGLGLSYPTVGAKAVSLPGQPTPTLP